MTEQAGVNNTKEYEDTLKYVVQGWDDGFITEKKTRILKTTLKVSVSFIAYLQAYCSLTHNVRSLRNKLKLLEV